MHDTRSPAGLPAQDITDEALMAHVARGDHAAFDTLAQRHLLRLKQAALRLLGDQHAAEDVAQEAMIRAWKSAGRFDPSRARAGTWLHRIAVNLAVDQLRRRRQDGALHDELVDPQDSAETAMADRQRLTALAQGLAMLPDRQRAALALIYGGGQTGAEAAKALDISLRALEGLLRRGRQVLRDYIRGRES